jgi:gluconolactonase
VDRGRRFSYGRRVNPIAYDVLDERFRRRIRLTARLERLYEGCRWAEGPAYFPAHRALVWSDIPNDRMLRLDEGSGRVSVFRSPANYSNGNTVDRQGRLVTCEHGGRRVTRTEHDGSITVVADRFEGRRFNSPNDVVVRSDGSIWFTDPTYGIDSNYEGVQAPSELDGSHVYRVDPVDGVVRRVTDDFLQPNGLAFSPDETRLYVVDSGASHRPDHPRHIRWFDVGPDGRLSGGGVFATLETASFDGLRLDEAGRVWASAGEAVHCYEPDGQLTGRIPIGEPVANLVFGGPKRNRLYICATTSLYSVLVAVNGARTF